MIYKSKPERARIRIQELLSPCHQVLWVLLSDLPSLCPSSLYVFNYNNATFINGGGVWDGLSCAAFCFLTDVLLTNVRGQ